MLLLCVSPRQKPKISQGWRGAQHRSLDRLFVDLILVLIASNCEVVVQPQRTCGVQG
jgi:hypothetical protein